MLSALGARVTIAGPKGERTVPVEALSTGYYETVLARDELDHRGDRPAAREEARRVSQVHHALGRRLAGARDGGRARDRGRRDMARRAPSSARRASSSARRPTGRRGSPQPKACSAARAPTTRRSRARATRRRTSSPSSATRSGSAAYKKQLARVYLRRAVRAALGPIPMKRASTPTETPQVGRAIPRLESWQKVTGRAEYVHNLRLPGMLYGKIFRSTVPARAHQAHRRRPPPRRSAACTASSPPTTSAPSSPSRTTARRSTTSRSSRSTRCATSASRSRSCSPPIRTSPRRRRT